MSRVPMGRLGRGRQIRLPFGPMRPVANPNLVPQGISAELISEKWGSAARPNDAFSVESHRRAARATERPFSTARSCRSMSPTDDGCRTVTRDEGIRADSTSKSSPKLKPAFKPDGVITAANSSQITDGAAAVLIMSEAKAQALGPEGPRPLPHVRAAGVDPVMMLTGPIPATTKVLERANMTLDQMDLVEINEAFGAGSARLGEKNTTRT